MIQLMQDLTCGATLLCLVLMPFAVNLEVI